MYDSFKDQQEGFHNEAYYDALREECLKCLEDFRGYVSKKYDVSVSSDKWLSSFEGGSSFYGFFGVSEPNEDDSDNDDKPFEGAWLFESALIDRD